MQLITWDHREQPDWTAIQDALIALGSPVCLTMIETHDDQNALLLSDGPVSHVAAEDRYQHYLATGE